MGALATSQQLRIRVRATATIDPGVADGQVRIAIRNPSSGAIYRSVEKAFPAAVGRDSVEVDDELPLGTHDFRVEIARTVGTATLENYGIIYGVDGDEAPRSFSALRDTPADYSAAGVGDMVVGSAAAGSSTVTGLGFQPQSAGLSAGGAAVVTSPYGWALHDDNDDPIGGWADDNNNLYIPQKGTLLIFVYSEHGRLRQRVTLAGMTTPDVVDVWADSPKFFALNKTDRKVYGFNMDSMALQDDDADTAVAAQPLLADTFDVKAEYTNLKGIAGNNAEIYVLNSLAGSARVGRYYRSNYLYNRCFNVVNVVSPHDALTFSLDFFTIYGGTIQRVNTATLSDQTHVLTMRDEGGSTLNVKGIARSHGTWWGIAPDSAGQHRVYAYDVDTEALLIPGEPRPASRVHSGIIRLADDDEVKNVRTARNQGVTSANLGALDMTLSTSGFAHRDTPRETLGGQAHPAVAVTPNGFGAALDTALGGWMRQFVDCSAIQPAGGLPR